MAVNSNGFKNRKKYVKGHKVADERNCLIAIQEGINNHSYHIKQELQGGSFHKIRNHAPAVFVVALKKSVMK